MEHEHAVELVESRAQPGDIEEFAREHKLRTVAAYLLRDSGDLPDFGHAAEVVRRALTAESATDTAGG